MPRQSIAVRAERSGNSPAAITKARTDAISQMNAQLHRKFKRLEKTMNDLRSENIRYYWRIGTLCNEIEADETKYLGNNGEKGLKLVEQALSTQARTIRKAMQFAGLYDQDQMEELISWHNTDTDFRLNWGHVGFLMTLNTENQRNKYAEEAVEKMLDPNALHDLIKRRFNRGGTHGRSHAMPATVSAQIRQMHSVCRTWVGKNDNIWNGSTESVFSNVMTVPTGEVEATMVDQIHEIRDYMQGIATAASDNLAKLDRAEEYLRSALEEQAQADEVESEPAPAASRRGGSRGGRGARALDMASS